MIRLESPDQAVSWIRALMQSSGLPGGSMSIDSRKINPGDAFIAWPGAASDGRHHVAAALAAGAVACIVEQNEVEAFDFKDPRIASYSGLKKACGPLAAAFFNHPSRQLRVVAVTGTNGKTTTAWWLATALGRLGLKSAVVGTLGIGVPGQAMQETGLTTPDPVLLHQQLRHLANDGCAVVVIEASSIGIVEHRLDGLDIEIAAFTNFSQDHLDYHGSMAKYWEAKAALFRWPGLKSAIINTGDMKGHELAQRLKLGGLHVLTVCAFCGGDDTGIGNIDTGYINCNSANFQVNNIISTPNGLNFNLLQPDTNQAFFFTSDIFGIYNISNLLGVIATLYAMNVLLVDTVNACKNLPAVPGRSETLSAPDKPLVVIDYAHTPDALEKILGALMPLAKQRGGAITCLFGCGGDRDSAKRKWMGAAAEKGADHVLLTSDNPRSEAPLVIIDQILQGFINPHAVWMEPDRRLAIAEAIRCASLRDIVLIAGKGHETTQEIEGLKIHFSDKEEALKAIDSWVDTANSGGKNWLTRSLETFER